MVHEDLSTRTFKQLLNADVKIPTDHIQLSSQERCAAVLTLRPIRSMVLEEVSFVVQSL